jgi:hypothetical protein
VQGVGARVALAILSALTGDELHRAIASGDKAMVARAQGVGPKLAQRIVNELKDKAGGVVLGGGGAPVLSAAGFGADAVSALQNLGFRPAEASAAVAKAEAELGAEATLDALVRLALKKGGALGFREGVCNAGDGHSDASRRRRLCRVKPETGTTTQGESVEEALVNLREAVDLFLEDEPVKLGGS